MSGPTLLISPPPPSFSVCLSLRLSLSLSLSLSSPHITWTTALRALRKEKNIAACLLDCPVKNRSLRIKYRDNKSIVGKKISLCHFIAPDCLVRHPPPPPPPFFSQIDLNICIAQSYNPHIICWLLPQPHTHRIM